MAEPLDFENQLKIALNELISDVGKGRPGTLLIEQEPGASNKVVDSVLESFKDTKIWYASCADFSHSVFEQLLPGHLAHLTKMERPPRIEMAIISNPAGMNLGTIQRDDSSLDADIISGMMEAVRNFVKDSLAIHTGGQAQEGGLERFEMHGYSILVHPGDVVNISLIISGSVPGPLKEDLGRTMGVIEERYGPTLESWDGSMSKIEGIEKPLERTFFSGRYEGVWDYDELKLKQSKMYSEVIRSIEGAAHEAPLVLSIRNTQSMDAEDLVQLNFLLRNVPFMQAAVLISHIRQPDNVKLASLLTTIEALENKKCISQPPGDDVLEKMRTEIPDKWPQHETVLQSASMINMFDIDVLSEVSGTPRDSLEKVRETFVEYGIISGNGLIDQSITRHISENMDDGNLFETAKKCLEAMERRRPDDYDRLAHLCILLADRDDSYRSGLVKYATKAGDRYRECLNWPAAVEMWMVAFENDTNPESQMLVLWNSIELMWMQAELDPLSKACEKMLGIASANDDNHYLGLVYWMLGRLDTRRGDYNNAMTNLKQAEILFEMLNDRQHLAYIMNTKASVYTRLDKKDKSLEEYGKAQEIAENINDLGLLARLKVNVGYNYVFRKRYDDAEELLLSALNIMDESGIIKDKATAYWNLGLMRYYQERFEDSTAYCQKSFNLAEEMSNWLVMIQALTTISAAYEKLNEMEESERSTLEAQKLSERTGEGDLLALSYNVFEIHHRRSLDWIQRVGDTIDSTNVYSSTLAELRTDILDRFFQYLDKMEKLLSVESDKARREEVLAKLEGLKDKLMEE